MDLKNKIALVTGGRVGIGAAIVSDLLAKGVIVIGTSRTYDPNPGLAFASKKDYSESSHELYNRYIPVLLEIINESEINRLFSLIHKQYGQLDILINNAGTGVFKKARDITPAEWRNVLNVNLHGVFFCAREAYALMQKHGGRIVNIGSIAGKIPLQDNLVYAVSKFGLRGLSLNLAQEWAPEKIGVTLISSGAVRTEIWNSRARFDPERMLNPEDVARVVMDVLEKPLSIRIDEIDIAPPEGIL